MKDYFKSVRCLEDVKELYKKYVLELHPYKGDNMWDFIEMKKQYDSAFNRLKTFIELSMKITMKNSMKK